MNSGKKYKQNSEKVVSKKTYGTQEAFAILNSFEKAKFDETVELHVRLGVDSRHADQQVRGAIVLPNGTGKNVKVLVFAKNDQLDEAKQAGAEYVGRSHHHTVFKGSKALDLPRESGSC